MHKLIAIILLCAAGTAYATQGGVPGKDAAGAQSITLRGKVIDFRTGEPIAKALVSIRSQNLQTVTADSSSRTSPQVKPSST